MRYMGNKSRHALDIFNVIKQNVDISRGSSWVEPFVGSAGMAVKVVRELKSYNYTFLGCDINRYLISLFLALQSGWLPNDFYSEEEYQKAKLESKVYDDSSLTRNAEIGFIGFGCSFGGKWFGGYARSLDKSGNPINYAKQSKTSLLKDIQEIQEINFLYCNYLHLEIPDKSIIYCDPPYAHTTKYKDAFKHDEFWKWCDTQVSLGYPVFVSEYVAPAHWVAIWEKPVNVGLDSKRSKKETGIKVGCEKLFMSRKID